MIPKYRTRYKFNSEMAAGKEERKKIQIKQIPYCDADFGKIIKGNKFLL